jgi:hypothetical protein
MRIIGIELRVQYMHPRFGGQQQELAVIPVDIELELDPPEISYQYARATMNGTLHTTRGDITIPSFDIGEILPHVSGLKFKSHQR